MRYLSREEVRSLDRRVIEEYGVPGIVLMENAGRGIAERLMKLGVNGRVLICAGKGNNAGDGFVIARHLDNAGVAVRVLTFGSPETLTGDAATNYGIIVRAGIEVAAPPADDAALQRELDGAEWLVDALLGTGLTGPVRAPFDRAITAINSAPGSVLAVDIPSGLDCDLGEPLGVAVRAHHTATLLAPKKGFANPESAPWVGKLHVLGIGAPWRALGER